MAEHPLPTPLESDAVFIGWQTTPSGSIIPLFNVTVPGHPSYRSTVSDATLRRLSLRVPETLSPYEETEPPPWHDLGVELHHPKTAREAMEIAGLDYAVTREPIERKTGLRHDGFASVRADTGEVLAVVGEDFEPTQNRDAFTFFDALVATHRAEYETAGVLGAGGRVWLLAKLPGYIMVHGNDIVHKFLLLTNSQTDGGCVNAKLTPIRAICNNSLTSDLQSVDEMRIWPVANAARRLEQAAILLASTTSFYERLDTVFNAMAAKEITPLQLREYVVALVPDEGEGENAAEAERTRNDVLQLHESGRGARLAHGTLWGAFNSISEYTDYKMLNGNETGRLDSIWFGRGEQIKRKAFHLAEHMLQT